MGVEIERKYLIKKPNILELNQKYGNVVKIDIKQYYLAELNDMERRVRREKIGDDVLYFYTEKSIGGLKRIENERKIDIDTFLELMKERNFDLNEISKRRYVYDYKGFKFEIDIYSFWRDIATVEIELASADEQFEMLPDLEIIKDVTEDKRFKNRNLAKDTNII